MSAANRVSYRAFLLRLRKLAKRALENYGLERAELKFKSYSGNGLYQVNVPHSRKREFSVSPGRYALRLHQPGYMSPDYIRSELEWLSALCKAGIDVPRPFMNVDGDWLTTVDMGYDVPSQRNCTLLSWVEGRFLEKGLRPKHFKALGEVTGKLQEQSMLWKKPKGFKRPHWDWEGLFGDGFDYGFAAKDAREAIPKKHRQAFYDVLERVEEASQQLGKGKKVYGLIHADLGNTVFRVGQARPFDFDDCGFGYWIFDLGVVLAHYILDSESTSPKMRDALIEGYQDTSILPELNLEYLDLFTAARLAQLIFFYQGMALQFPQHRDEASREINHSAKYLKRILKKMQD
ncbi:MAG: phosphotransferase enzyme family protein [Candidatus Thorarchaeota archaeon]|jgi:Ser/Thr protein kinase RdoA (MazF antagonist)